MPPCVGYWKLATTLALALARGKFKKLGKI
jgi:hypothetical protein